MHPVFLPLGGANLPRQLGRWMFAVVVAVFALVWSGGRDLRLPLFAFGPIFIAMAMGPLSPERLGAGRMRNSLNDLAAANSIGTNSGLKPAAEIKWSPGDATTIRNIVVGSTPRFVS